MTRRWAEVATGAAILAATAGVISWGWGYGGRPDRGRVTTPAPPAVRPWAPPVGDVEDVLGDGPDEMPAELPKAAVDAQVGTTPTGLPLYEGPNGGIYHVSRGGRKVYHADRRAER